MTGAFTSWCIGPCASCAFTATMKLAFGNGMTRAKLCSESLTFTASGQRLVLTREQVIALCVCSDAGPHDPVMPL